ncbi:hypothetical protein F4604DRAFT_1682975 [Suillus subluteus]|nr:hypothetical protein F4604DRAFT_1682975 [Suillus subluteus]
MTFTSSISLETAALISTVLEGILYGFSVLMFIGTMWSMTYKRSMRDVNRPVAAAAVLLSVLSTAHMVLSIIRIEYGFVTYQGVPAAYFADVSQETYVIKNSIYVLQTLLGDAVAIYRCYIVWQAAWVIILPSLLWCGVAVYGDSQTSSTGIISTTVNVECMGVFCVLTLLANLSSSGLLAYRIWKIERNVSSSRTFKGHDHEYNSVSQPVISIAFYMVIIRIAIGQNAHSQVLTVRGGMTSETERGSFPQYSVKPLQVNTPRSTHTDSTRVYGTSSWNQSRPPTGKEYLDETSCDPLSG